MKDIRTLQEEYKSGDRKAAEGLLKAFEPMINIWLTSLTGGKIFYKNHELRCFYAFFDKDINKGCEMLFKSLKSNYQRQDILQILRLSLLETSLKYTSISKGFKYEVKKNLFKMTSDPLTYRTTVKGADMLENIAIDSDTLETSDTIVAIPNKDVNMIEQIDVLLYELVGEQLYAPAKLYYLENKTLSKTALLCNISENKLNKALESVKKKTIAYFNLQESL